MKVGPKRSAAQRAEPSATQHCTQDQSYHEGGHVMLLLLLFFDGGRAVSATFLRLLCALRSCR